MRIAIANQARSGETRVALVPDRVGSLAALGAHVLVEPGAGALAGFADLAYEAAGAAVSTDALPGADVVLAVQPLDAEQISRLREGAVVISFFPVADQEVLLPLLRARGATVFAMEQVPRISRAQPMDALTSQALVVGYRGVLVAAELLDRFFPATVTAAGTVPAAEVLVLGTGVAGLQAIATARRLGATVRGYDVRASSAEEIASLGANPIDLGLPPLDGAAGYLRTLLPERARTQAALLAPYVERADVLICTASVPGAVAPVLVSAATVASMRPGSVVVDLAAEAGGNVEGSRPGEVVTLGQVRVWGGAAVPGQMPRHASTLYAQNVVHLLTLMTRAGSPATFAPDYDDEIVAGANVLRASRG